ncbi:MFS transporter [Miltoncostaea marina]|uniref:MFS transporter n=1 Tax=Miltoncostaea marina TaxID=2843215 RepID=UPI003CCE95D8
MRPTNRTPSRWWALMLIAAAQFMVIMDTSIIGVALPEIQRELGFSQSGLSWVFNAYVIALGGLLLLGGRLADLLGARRVFMAGWFVLTGASILAGLAGGPALEVTGRALQGVGAALIAPSALALLMGLFAHDPRELTRALAVYGAAAPAGGTAGVFLGGVLTEWADWRWVFLVNVPVGLVALAVSTRLLPAAVARRGRIDLPGAVAVTGAISLAVFGVVRAPEDGWSSAQTLGSLAGAAALLAAFVVMQSRRRDPLVRLAIFRAPNLSAANLVAALLGAAWIPMWFFLNLYLQQVLGYGAFEAGAALLPMTAAIMLLMVGATGRLVTRFGFVPVSAVGLAVLAAGVGWLSRVPVGGGFLADVLPASLVAAVGMSLAYIPVMIAALSGAAPQEAGLASGIFNTTYQVGSALGLAAMTALAAGFGADQLGDPVAMTDGFQAALIGAAVIAGVAALAALALLRRPRPAPPAREEPASAAEPLREVAAR